MNRVIGIDLGTANVVSAVYINHTPVIIPNAEGERSTPSVVSIDPATGQVLVGTSAKRQAVLNPRGTIFSVKRLMGKTFDHVRDELPYLPYEVVRGSTGDAQIRVGSRTYIPAEISAMILKKVKADASSFLQEEVKQAVITVPAYFDDRQRKATQIAGKLAGLDILRIINEPTAAALAYCTARSKENCQIAVVHLGGGTLDISILDVGDGVFQVMSVCGDSRLGGDNFDQVIMDWALEKLRQTLDAKQTCEPTLVEMLKWEAEKVKCQLSTQTTAEMIFPYQRIGRSKIYSTLTLTIDRYEFEQKAKSLIEKISAPCKLALTDAHLSSVDHVILVGQQTRMPAVQDAVEGVFNKKPRRDIDPAEVVALGAAIQAGVLSGEVNDVLLMDVIPLTLSVETLGGVASRLIERDTTIPTRRSQIFSTASDNQTQVEIRVVQGERPMAADNNCIGTITLDGIQPAPRGKPQIEVMFDIDGNGVLRVSAIDQGTGHSVTIRIGDAQISRPSLR